YRCHSCNRVYKYKHGLVQHVRYECGKEPQFRCPEPSCGYKSNRKFNLKIHIMSQHEQQCSRCLMRCYKNKKSLLRHLRYECHKDPTFSCPYCPHKAKYKNTLVTHIKQRHRQVVCDRNFV
ncbi:hypothetical protein BDFB_000073, partial [Asbolus verrucosus]